LTKFFSIHFFAFTSLSSLLSFSICLKFALIALKKRKKAKVFSFIYG